MAKKALVLVSGGLDSATCLYWAKDNFDEVRAITFNYFQRIHREKIASRRITNLAKVNLIEVELPFLKEKSDYSSFKTKTRAQPSHSYIPLRNLIFYSISGYFAQVSKIQNIVGGHNASDGNIFKDANSFYLGRMNKLMAQGLLGSIDCKIILPLKSMSRIGVIRLAMALNVPIWLTWSCHRDGEFHCGQCYACKQRLNAFKVLSLADPALYTGRRKG
jgi:7-cyano-7-deazaguanine synthase